MPLGTLDRTPPPIFRQGPSALTKLVFFAALAVFLMVADGRLRLIQPLRSGLAVVLLPVQRALAAPVALWTSARDYLGGLDAALQAAQRASARLAAQSAQAARAASLAQENERLRALLSLREAIAARTQAAEILYEASDPFSRKVFVDRGLAQGVVAGAPVLGEAGVLGQVTRLYPLTAEVTLLVDKDGAIPVLNTRTRQRSVAFGGLQLPGGGALELRFLPANADVRVGDALVTSGLDGVYPPGLPVARVAEVQRRAEAGFARILLEPAARAEGVRHVLLVEPLALQLPARPQAGANTADTGAGGAAQGLAQ
ncbi:MAG: rod shape-determining protein MreC [Rubrivivax sp. SCN 71-131]|nr:MAG: rod shape-determining protein MreC [Rubrivivax sp. SCN 71-131]